MSTLFAVLNVAVGLAVVCIAICIGIYAAGYPRAARKAFDFLVFLWTFICILYAASAINAKLPANALHAKDMQKQQVTINRSYLKKPPSLLGQFKAAIDKQPEVWQYASKDNEGG